MADMMVPVKRTPVNAADFARALARVWSKVETAPLTKRACAVLYAQFMIETGGVHIYNFNFGNSKDVAGDGIDWHALKGTWEGVTKAEATRLISQGLAALDTNPNHIKAVHPRTAIVFQPPHPTTRFSAFKSIDDGMEYHLRLISKTKFRTAWPCVLLGDVAGFAAALKDRGYFTASAAAYTRGVEGPFNNFMKLKVFEEAVAAATADPVVVTPPTAETPNPEHFFVEVTDRHGDVWWVCPMYVGPIGIGEAVELAKAQGCVLPTPELVDDIYAAADCKLNGWDIANAVTHDGTPRTMNSVETHAKVAAKIEALLDGRGNFRLLAGVFKDIVDIDGKPGLYGWHDANGKAIQGPYTKHALAWRDYSQGLRLVKRKT